jgi:transposase
MDHIAIDLGSRESQLCIRNEKNEIVLERRVSTRLLGSVLRKRPSGRVVIETSAEAFAVADVAKNCGHEVRVVPATLVRALGVGARGLKTDQRDARVLRGCFTENLVNRNISCAEARDGQPNSILATAVLSNGSDGRGVA